jgi:NhaP-type Na+/H+ or K+/H+ antiporter
MLLTAWLPVLLVRAPLSLPMVCVAIGAAYVWSPMPMLGVANPLENLALTERLTEFVVIVSLMGAGLKLDRPPGLRTWMTTWRLLAIAMPLTIAAIAALGWTILGLGAASAVLLGASLAPTDPVLASDVQVGPPNSTEEDPVRFALTSEAGLNDGLSFPFVHFAIALALSAETGEPWLARWLVVDVVWKLAAGASIGWIAGRIIAYVTFSLPAKMQLSNTNDGLVALGLTLLSYGVAEMIHGYGFIAVFVAAVTLRAAERAHSYHEELHAFAERIERVAMTLLLVCFGAAIAEGSVFGSIDWAMVAVALVTLLAVRPVAAFVSLIGTSPPLADRAAIAFFGIRGFGSFYYLAYALGHARFDGGGTLWTVICLVVVLSVVMHGVAVTPVMAYLDRRRAASMPA